MPGFYRNFGKRILDLLLAAPALLVLAPLIAAVALLVRIKLGRQILFSQWRPGMYGKPFRLYKFRTMTDARDAAGHLLPDAERLTPFGQMLRSTSLDELPELWNILRGDMSFVGPRPLLMQYLERYSAEQARRHEVLPGLTGWAQIHGRNAISWEEKFQLDVWYVDHVSLPLDLKIMWQTFWTVLSRAGINAADSVTIGEFQGSAGEGSEVLSRRNDCAQA